jgi:hypothetical protein
VHLYFSGELRETDRSEKSDRLVIDFPNSILESDTAEPDQSIGKTPQNFFIDNKPVSDRLIKFGANQDGVKVMEIDLQIDRTQQL